MLMYLSILIVFCTVSTWIYYYYKNYLKAKSVRNRIQTIKFTSAAHRVSPNSNYNNLNYSTTNRSNIDSPLNGSLTPDSIAYNEHVLRQRRFVARNLSQVNYISPNSIYGYAPSSSSSKKDKPKITREFTVKLSPFPATTSNLLTRFSSSFKVEPNDDVEQLSRASIGKSTLVVRGVEQETPTRVPDFQRTSVKRPMLLNDENDDDEDIFDLRNKKSKNTIDIDFDDDEDDDDMDLEIAGISASTVASKPGKAMKRTTNILDNENNFNLPKKKIKNNEIFSSYISSNSGYHQNKRKYSPETSVVTDFRRTKKRSHIEELELMTTNILSNIAERKDVSKSNLTYSQIVSDENVSKPSTSIEQRVDQEKSDKKSTPNDDSQPMIEETNNESQPNDITDKNKEEETLYPIPPYIYSVKDHEYDKKKIKNRLNRFLQAVQEANQDSKGTENSAFSIQTPMTPEIVAKEDVNVKFTLPSSSTSLFQPPAAKIDTIVASNSTNPTPITTAEKSQINNNDNNPTPNNISSTVSSNLGAEVKTSNITGFNLIMNNPIQTSTVSPSIGSQTITTPVPSKNNVTTSFSISLAPKPSMVDVTSGPSAAIDKGFGSNQEAKASDQSITKTLPLPSTTVPVATTSSFNFGVTPSTTSSTNLISSKVEVSKAFESSSSAITSNNNENDKKVTFSVPLTSSQSVSCSSNATETNPIQTSAQLSLPLNPPSVSNAPAMSGQFSFGTLGTSTNGMFFSNSTKSIDVPKTNPTTLLPTVSAKIDPNNQILTFAKTTEATPSILPKITAARRIPVAQINDSMSSNQPPPSAVPSMFSFGSNQNQSVLNVPNSQSQSNSNSLPSFKNLFNAASAATTPVAVCSAPTAGIFSSSGNTFGTLPPASSSTTSGFSFKAFPENKAQSINNNNSNPGQDSLFSFSKIDSTGQASNANVSKPTFSFAASQPAASAFTFGSQMQPPSSSSLFNPPQGLSNSNNVTKNNSSNIGFDFTAAASQLKSSTSGFNFNPIAPNPSSQTINPAPASFTFNAPQQPQSTQPFSFNATPTTTSNNNNNNNNSNSIFHFGSK